MVMNEVFVLSFLYALYVRLAKQVRENFVCVFSQMIKQYMKNKDWSEGATILWLLMT